MTVGSARKGMRSERQSCATWQALGGYLMPLDRRTYRIVRDSVPGDPRMPCPDPISAAAAQDAIRAGMPVRYPNDLLARAA